MTLSNKKGKKTIDLSVDLAKLSAFDDGDKWVVKGYATVFDNENVYGFSISKGAYTSVLGKNVKPKMFYNHLTRFGVPIGKWTKLEEDEIGLKVEGELTKGVALASDVYAALKAGTVDGLSVSVTIDEVDEREDGTFSVTSVSELTEISICAYPADGKARVSETLSADEIDESIECASTIRDLEAVLRDAGHFSKRQAQSLISKMKSALSEDAQRDADESKRAQALVDRLMKAAK